MTNVQYNKQKDRQGHMCRATKRREKGWERERVRERQRGREREIEKEKERERD